MFDNVSFLQEKQGEQILNKKKNMMVNQISDNRLSASLQSSLIEKIHSHNRSNTLGGIIQRRLPVVMDELREAVIESMHRVCANLPERLRNGFYLNIFMGEDVDLYDDNESMGLEDIVDRYDEFLRTCTVNKFLRVSQKIGHYDLTLNLCDEEKREMICKMIEDSKKSIPSEALPGFYLTIFTNVEIDLPEETVADISLLESLYLDFVKKSPLKDLKPIVENIRNYNNSKNDFEFSTFNIAEFRRLILMTIEEIDDRNHKNVYKRIFPGRLIEEIEDSFERKKQCKSIVNNACLEDLVRVYSILLGYPSVAFDLAKFYTPLGESDFNVLKAKAIGIFANLEVMCEIVAQQSFSLTGKDPFSSTGNEFKVPSLVYFGTKSRDPEMWKGIDFTIAQSAIKYAFTQLMVTKAPLKLCNKLLKNACLPVSSWEDGIKVLSRFESRHLGIIISNFECYCPDLLLDTSGKAVIGKGKKPVGRLTHTFRDTVTSTATKKEEAIATNPQYELMARDFLLQCLDFIRKMESGIVFEDLSGTLRNIGRPAFAQKGEILINHEEKGEFDQKVIENFIHECFHLMSGMIINDKGGYKKLMRFYNSSVWVKLFNADHYCSVLFPCAENQDWERMKHGSFSSRKSAPKTEDMKNGDKYCQLVSRWPEGVANLYSRLLFKRVEITSDICKIMGISTDAIGKEMRPVDYAFAEHTTYLYQKLSSLVHKKIYVPEALSLLTSDVSKWNDPAITPLEILAFPKIDWECEIPENINLLPQLEKDLEL